MQSMQVLAQSVGYTYDMDLGLLDRGVSANWNW